MCFYFLITTVVAFEYLSAIIHSQDVSPIPHRVLWHPHLYLAKDSTGEFYEIRHSSQYYDVSISFLQTSQSDAAPGIMNCECRFVKSEVEQQEETAFLQVMTPSKVKPRVDQKDKEISIGAYVPKPKEPDYRSIMEDYPVEPDQEEAKQVFYEEKRGYERRENEDYRQATNNVRGYSENEDYEDRQEYAEYNDYPVYKQPIHNDPAVYQPQYVAKNNYGYTQGRPNFEPHNYAQPTFNQPVYVNDYSSQPGPVYTQQPVYVNQVYQPDPNYVQQPHHKTPPLEYDSSYTLGQDQQDYVNQPHSKPPGHEYVQKEYVQEEYVPKAFTNQVHPKPPVQEYIQQEYYEQEYVKPAHASPGHLNQAGQDYVQQPVYVNQYVPQNTHGQPNYQAGYQNQYQTDYPPQGNFQNGFLPINYN